MTPRDKLRIVELHNPEHRAVRLKCFECLTVFCASKFDIKEIKEGERRLNIVGTICWCHVEERWKQPNSQHLLELLKHGVPYAALETPFWTICPACGDEIAVPVWALPRKWRIELDGEVISGERMAT